VAEAERFVGESGCDWLSVAIGNVHGAISGAAKDQKKIEARVFKEIKVKSGKLQTQKTDGTSADYWTKPWQYHGDKWLIEAEYREKGKTSWTDLPSGSVTLTDTTRTDGWRRINVDFSKTSVDPTKKTQEVKLKFRRCGGINGWGGTSLHLVICRNSFDSAYPGAKLKPAMAGTSTHEPGHSLGLVYGKPWQTSDSSRGAHCKFKDCVMWWQGYVGRPHDFHLPTKSDPGCNTFIREKDMSRTAMTPKWKFPR